MNGAERGTPSLSLGLGSLGSVWNDDVFRTAYEKLGVGLSLTDGDGRFLNVNQAFCQLTGFSQKELLSKDLQGIIHPEDFPLSLSGIDLVRSGELDRFVFENRYICKGEELVWVQNTIATISGESRGAVRFVLLVQSIGERKAAEKHLRESEDRYRDLVEHSHDLICTHDLNGILLSVNEAPLRILGYSRQEMVNKNLRDFVAPAARPLCDAYLAQIQKEGVAKGLLPVLTKGGEMRLWEYENSLRTNGVCPPVVRGMAHDVTQQKRAELALQRSEEKFSKAFRSSPIEMSISTLAEGRLLEVNDSFLKSTGFSRDDVVGRASIEIGLWVNPSERAAIVEEVQKNGRVTNREIRFRGKTGKVGIKLYSAELIHVGGEPRLLSVSTDITRQKHAIDEVRRLSRRLLSVQDEERHKIALELHESTAQNLVGVTALLAKLRTVPGCSDNEARRIIAECERLTKDCVEEVRTLSYELFPPMMDWGGIASAVRHYVSDFIERTDIEVHVEVNPALGRLPQDVELTLFRVAKESLTNVQLHSGSRTALIRFDLEARFVQMEVIDQGHGFPESSRKGERGLRFSFGVGIKGIMERINQVGGTFLIHSSPAGTTICVRVPTDEHKWPEGTHPVG